MSHNYALERQTQPTVELVPFKDFTELAEPLGRRLAEVVESNYDRIKLDFPNVPEWFGTPKAAQARIETAQRDKPADIGKYVVFPDVVTAPKETPEGAIGVATVVRGEVNYLQAPEPLRKLAKNVCRRTVTGASMAFWLGNREIRPDILRQQRLLLGSCIVRELFPLARKIIRPESDEEVWTLIRPGNVGSLHAFLNASYGFRYDGQPHIHPVGGPQRYAHVDGVRAKRQLYVVNTSAQ